MASRKRLLTFLICLFSMLASSGLIAPTPAAQAAAPLVVDDFEAALPSGQAGAIPIGFFTAQDNNSTTTFGRTAAPPAPVPNAATPNNVLKADYNVSSYGVVIHGFENAAHDQWVAQDWSAYAGMSFWLYGQNSGTTLFVDVIDNRNPGATTDDAERFSLTLADDFVGWKQIELPFSSFARKEIGNGAPNDGFTLTEVHGWALGSLTTSGTKTFYIDDVALYGTAPVRPLTVGFSASTYSVTEGATAAVEVKLSKPAASPVTVHYQTRPGQAVAGRDYTPSAGTLTFAPNVTRQSFSVPTFDNAKYQGARGVLLELSSPDGAAMGIPPVAYLNIADNESYDSTLLEDFETYPYLWNDNNNAALANPELAAGNPLALPGQGAYERVLQAGSQHGKSSFEFGRQFAAGQDWSASGGLSFWYYGQNSGRDIGVTITNNRSSAQDTDPSKWKLAWSDEFNSRTGSAPDPAIWSREIGDGTAIGNAGWGNSELEYYTNSTDNAATDGKGNLVITTKPVKPNSSLQCYYGPCQYTSARLLTKNKFEVAYGRIEARVKVPRGAGLWPAFWMLGNDIDQVNWPQTGEIDIMENVGREPKRVFGTLHGPGYSGGSAFGGIYDFDQPVADNFHTFTVEWQPNKIVWYVDGIKYHQAEPSNVAPNQWVYNHPFFLLLNVAVGGNFGGPVGASTIFPQKTLVDYVRVYQARPRPVEFGAHFRDSFTGWQKISIPFASFTGAPGKTLDLTSVRGLRFEAPSGLKKPLLIDQLRLNCTAEVIVTSGADSGAGSLRKAIGSVCAGGTIRFAPALAGQTITNLSALTVGKSLTIDGAGAPGLAISGGDSVRVFEISASASATIRNLTISHGYGFELAGGILNNGTLALDHVVIANSRVTTSGVDFWKGGAGIYNGDGSTLTLRDSTVRDNQVEGAAGGGVYGFFNSAVTIERSTISGNSASDVGGGIRSLGNFTITNSTISGNQSTGWHGGALFHTDGVMRIVNSTLANNSAPAGASGGAFVGTFTPASATLSFTNSIVAGNSGEQCFYAPFGAGVVTLASGGHNLGGDNTCGMSASGDRAGVDPLLGPLAANGGPTLTHALLAGSPAIDAADVAASPPSDQRGVSRPQGAGPDIGAFEAAP